MWSKVGKTAVAVVCTVLLSGCDPHNIRDDRVLDIKKKEGLAELRTVVEAVQAAIIETSDAFPSHPRPELAKLIDQQCTTARTAAKLKCDTEFSRATEECAKLTGTALDSRCTSLLTVADRACVQAAKTFDVTSLCSKGDALAGVTIQKATLALDTVRISDKGGSFKFVVLKFGASKSFKEVQHLDLVFMPVPSIDLTGARAETLGIDLQTLNSVMRDQSVRDSKPKITLLSRKDLIEARNKNRSPSESVGGPAKPQGLVNADALITFIRGAAAAASIDKIGDKDAALITNSFKVSFTFEVTKKGEAGLEWELAPNSASFGGGRSATVGNQLTLEFGQPE
jgi:hypothetical protein